MAAEPLASGKRSGGLSSRGVPTISEMDACPTSLLFALNRVVLNTSGANEECSWNRLLRDRQKFAQLRTISSFFGPGMALVTEGISSMCDW